MKIDIVVHFDASQQRELKRPFRPPESPIKRVGPRAADLQRDIDGLPIAYRYLTPPSPAVGGQAQGTGTARVVDG